MSAERLVRMTYWGGWASAAVAVLYKFLYIIGAGAPIGMQIQVYPRHLWQLGFLLFVICIASDTFARKKAA